MTAILLSLVLNGLLIFLTLALIQRRRMFEQPGLLALFFGVYFLDNLTITLTNRFPVLQFVPNPTWEGFLVCAWSGKLYSVLLVLGLLWLAPFPVDREQVGLTLRQKEGFFLPASLVILALAAWSLLVGIHSPKGQLNFGVLAYLALMPALNEEVVYRGFLLAVLNRLMPPRHNLFGAQIGWGAIVTSLLFGLLHGLWLDNDLAVQLDVIALRNSAISGFIFAWLRERTGSLALPMLAHGMEDFLFFLPRMV
ncbi:MAG: CPBP family intramembrane glutamic endopeptidase [Bacteroidota bacterium]